MKQEIFLVKEMAREFKPKLWKIKKQHRYTKMLEIWRKYCENVYINNMPKLINEPKQLISAVEEEPDVVKEKV